MTRQERFPAALAHLFIIIPLWGILGAAAVWFVARQRSRRVAFQARQAVFFHGLMLLVANLIIGLKLLLRLAEVLNLPLWAFLDASHGLLWKTLFVLYVLICFAAAWSVLRGQDFLYPIVGPPLTERGVR